MATDKYFNIAANLALESEMLYRHGSVVVKSGKIIGKGFNSLRSRHYDRTTRTSTNVPSTHAEVSALKKTTQKGYCLL